MKKKAIFATALVVALIVIDQVIKVWVKTHMTIGEQIVVAPWFRIDFIENKGMAWGMQIGSKLFLSLFRIVAVGFLVWYIRREIGRNARWGYLTMLCMICAGAAGNIFDSVVYGQIFTQSTPFDVATLVPWGEGYETKLLCGSVVDMFYFPIWHGTLPSWLPLIGGHELTFFNAIFNFADACITTGVICMLLFFNKDLSASTSSFSKKSEHDNAGEAASEGNDSNGQAKNKATDD